MTKHKSENVFKFKSFSEKLSEIDLRSSVLYRVEHANELPEENRSYLNQCLEKWNVLNLTEEYTKFEKELKNVHTNSLAQVLHQKDKIVEILLLGLKNATQLSLQPILELSVAVARDLQEEFLVYFSDFFNHLINILNTKDAEKTEFALISLASMLKILKPFLCKNISQLIHQMLPLLNEKEQSDYIINFAAECFAFLIRSLKNKEFLLIQYLRSLQNKEEFILGSGKLFFEILKGTTGNFHSKGEDFLSLLFESFGKSENEKLFYILREILAQTIGDIFSYIDAKFIPSYWNTLEKSLERAVKDELMEEKISGIRCMIQILGQSIEQGGEKVYNLPRIINLLIVIIDRNVPIDIMMLITEIGAIILLSKKFEISQLDASRLAKKILQTEYAEVFESFVLNSIESAQFDILIMPDFLKYFERHFSLSNLKNLALIITKRRQNPLLKESKFESYNIHIKDSIVQHKVLDYILQYSPEKDYESFILAMHVLPHLVTFCDKERIEKHLQCLSDALLEKIISDPDIIYNYLYALTATNILWIYGSYNFNSLLEHLPRMLNRSTNFSLLKIVKYAIQFSSNISGMLPQYNLKNIEAVLKNNLLSTRQEIRKLSIQILYLLNPSSTNYTIFKEIQEIESTIHNYREQIILLQKLSYDVHCRQLNKCTEGANEVLNFCLGFLQTNFEPLWKPTRDILDSYAQGFDIDEFWKIFYSQLKMVAKYESDREDFAQHENERVQNDFVKEEIKHFLYSRDRYDNILYWSNLLEFLSETNSNVVERRQRDIVEMFCGFLERNKLESNESEHDSSKGRQKLLICHLKVLCRLEKIKSAYKSHQLKIILLDFLIHRNFHVQKLALQCLLRYKGADMHKFKDIFLNCIEEKTFRQELASLNLNETVSNEQRAQFFEIFSRILYSKLTVKVNKKDQDGFKTKKEIIVRFMNQLREPELELLTDISTKKIICLNEHDLLYLPQETNKVQNLGIHEVQSILEFLNLIRKNVAGAFTESYQRKILRLILTISCFTVKESTAIHKSCKQECLHILTDFFCQYESFMWNDSEIELLFELFIWNQLATFSANSSQNVSGLMKLFVEWSKNPKYYKYLAKRNKEGNFPMLCIIGLLANKSTTNIVIDCVFSILESLLQTQGAELHEFSEYKDGEKLIVPFVPEILLKIKERLNIKRYKVVDSKTLSILSKITVLVTNEDHSKLMLDILVPLIVKKVQNTNQDSDGTMKLLTTIFNLLKCVQDSNSYLKQLFVLFEFISEIDQRKFIIRMMNQYLNNSKLKSVIVELNAFDRRWIEQPDYDRRLKVFHQLEEEEITMEMSLLVIYHCFFFLKHEKDLAIRDNSSHYLKYMCTKFLEKSETKQETDYFLDKIILNSIRQKIQGPHDMRHESLTLLGELARNYSKLHPILADLNLLTDSDRELDFFDNIIHLQKFRHMKALRKASLVLSSPSHKFNIRTLTDFLLPLSKVFLCQEEYVRKSKVIEAAIEYLSCICNLLPWNHYESVLKLYIRKMKNPVRIYQKQLIKIVCEVLNSFHFIVTNEEEYICDEENDDKNDDLNTDADSNNGDITEPAVLMHSNAQRILKSLKFRLIPSILKIIDELSKNSAHKINKEERKLREKTDMMKIPLSLPLIKLLQKLPLKYLQQYLQQIVLKVASFLKSSLKQVRATARHTLKEILNVIGVNYLELVIEYLSGMLCKGFQRNVLSVTIYTFIDSLKNQLNETTVTDKILMRVLDICLNDIFGKSTQEQDNAMSKSRVPESRPSRKSFLSLKILASSISEKCIIDLLIPFKNKLMETQSKKTVIKIEECLTQIASGLSKNIKISDEALMIIIYGIISDSIPGLLSHDSKHKKGGKQGNGKTDCLIIAEEPKRRGASEMNKNISRNIQTNSHVLVEFGLKMLQTSLEENKYSEPHLESFTPFLLDSIKSNILQINILAIKCLGLLWHKKIMLESLKTSCHEIVAEIFKLVHKNTSRNFSKKDNTYLLIKNSFKSMIALIRHVDYYTVREDQLKALLLYIEQDLPLASNENKTSFLLLKTILEKKLTAPEIHGIMKKAAEISITSEQTEKRDAIRLIILIYLMEYPLGKKIDDILKFYVAQLSYEETFGRESAISMMCLIFKHFPKPLLGKFCDLFFLALGTRLVNDESITCRKKVAESIELLIKQVSNDSREQLFNMVTLLLEEKNSAHKEMAAQLTVRFLNAGEKEFLSTKLSKLLLLLSKSLTEYFNSSEPGRFVRVKRLKTENSDDEAKEEFNRDHLLIQSLIAISTLIECNSEHILREESNMPIIKEIGIQAQTFLSHDHVWVRIYALKIIFLIISNTNYEAIQSYWINGVSTAETHIFPSSKSDFQSLVFDVIVQLKPDVDAELLKMIKDFLFVTAKAIKNVPFSVMVNDKKDFNLLWLIRRLRYAVHGEIATAPSSCVIRKCVFNFFFNLIDLVDPEVLRKLANSILKAVLREIVDGEHIIEELKQVGLQVCHKIKSLIGQAYEKIQSEFHSQALHKRVSRRKILAHEKIKYPEKAAYRAISKQLKKQNSKKRKQQEDYGLQKKKKRIGIHEMN